MADPEIDFIIPFHKSSWSASLYKSLGLEGYEDFTDYQNEKKAGTKIETMTRLNIGTSARQAMRTHRFTLRSAELTVAHLNLLK